MVSAAFNSAPAAVRYVDVNSATPTPPYTNWATAATNIQDAVDVALAGDEVLVTNGVYQTGGGGINRVIVDKPVTVQSVNGPTETRIVGGYSTRCAHLANGALIAGFTLTNGSAKTAGGGTSISGAGGAVSSPAGGGTVSNCVMTGNWADTYGGAAYNTTLINCVLSNNVGGYGGGASGGALTNCTLSDNRASFGGGAHSNVLSNCTLTDNGAYGDGGGAYNCILNDCTVASNHADLGGGTYGGTSTNCIFTHNSALRKGGGAYQTTISDSVLARNGVNGGGSSEGGGAYECSLFRSVLTENVAYGSSAYGGGAFGGALEGCTLSWNVAGLGGGTAYSRLVNCLLLRNQAGAGGGAFRASLNNCTLSINSASAQGGGAYESSIRNSIVYYNSAPFGENYRNGTLINPPIIASCITPMPTNGVGNISAEPLFVDQATGNLRLQSNSPCINAGNNSYAPSGVDLDGNPRIAGGTVDMGAYEFQTPSSLLSYAWAQQYGLPTDGSADYSDADTDLMNNWQEWIAGTVPTDVASALRLLTPTPGVSGTIVSWESVSNRTYFLERASDLGDQPAFSMLTSNIVGELGTTSFTDTNAVGSGPFFYQVVEQRPFLRPDSF